MYLYTGIQTTGLDFEKDDIVRLSFIIEDKNFNIITSGLFEIKPRKGKLPSEISKDALKFNNLTIDTLRTFKPPSEACKEFLDILEGDQYTYIGHYSDFDLSFLNNFIEMYSEKHLNDYIKEVVDVIELAKMAEFRNKEKHFSNYRLKTLTEHFNVAYEPSEIETKVEAVRNIKHIISDF